MSEHPTLTSLGLLLVVGVALFLLPGCAVNGKPMRAAPESSLPAKSWYIAGKAAGNASVSCSFVEFDERGDFLDFNQHLDCQGKLRQLISEGPVLLVIYCHGWKNNSQSGDVVEFNAFLTKLAASSDIRVHGVYLGWRGNSFRPYVDTGKESAYYQETAKTFGGPIVDAEYLRGSRWTGVIPETLSYWNRKNAAENHVSGLPMARAIFTYAATAKGYGRSTGNRVCVMGHSFGALMLEQSLGQAMTGALTMQWWGRPGENETFRGLPFDMVLFVNSAAPSIYAKQMRDFLEAHRRALGRNHDADQDVPVIVSLTSTADWATGVVHPIGNILAPLDPSLQRRYTSGILAKAGQDGVFPTHRGIRQSDFYTRTPVHQPLLINHWIEKQAGEKLPPDSSVFSENLKMGTADPDLFFTSNARGPAAAWKIASKPKGGPLVVDGMVPAMANSDYWIVTCDKELISGHNDVWSTTTMEMYAGIFRAVESRRGKAVRVARPSEPRP